MLIILKFLISVASLIFIGYLPTYFLLINNENRYMSYNSAAGKFVIVFISFYTGGLIINVYLMVLSLFNVDYDTEAICGISILFFALFVYWFFSKRFGSRENRRARDINREISRTFSIARGHKNDDAVKLNFKELPAAKNQDSEEKILHSKKNIINILFIIMVIILVLNFLAVTFLTVLFPIRFWDAVSCWSLKGKAFFIDRNITDFFSGHDYKFSHISYPLYLPLLQTWIYLWIGEVNENIVKLIFPLFFASLLFMLYFYFRRNLNRLLSVFLVMAFSLIPIIADHGYIEYTNLLFSIMLLMGSYSLFLSRRLDGSLSYMILSSIFFTSLSLIRSEGFFYMLLFLIFVLVFFLRDIFNKKRGIRTNLKFIVPIIISVTVFFIWFLVKLKLGLPFISTEWFNLTQSSDGGIGGKSIFAFFDPVRGLKVFVSEFLYSSYDSTRAFFKSFYGPVWLILFILFLVNIKNILKRHRWIFSIFILFGIVMLYISMGFIQDFATSIERYLLHIFPLLYLWILSSSFRLYFKVKI